MPGNQHKPASSLEVKEGEPKIHTVYAYIQPREAHGGWNRTDKVLALYTNQEEPIALARMNDMFATEADVITPLHVYEREEDLPEEIRKSMRPDNGRRAPMAVLEKEKDVVYSVLPNTESTEGSGESFIWALVTDPALANKIASGNGPSGSNAKVVALPLNKFPIAEGQAGDVVIRRDKKGGLTDELYA